MPRPICSAHGTKNPLPLGMGSVKNADKAFRRFFKGQSRFPRFKKKNKSDVKMYFVKTDAKTIIPCERHRIKIPTLG